MFKYREELGALILDSIQGSLITEEAKQHSIAGGNAQGKTGLGGVTVQTLAIAANVSQALSLARHHAKCFVPNISFNPHN